MSSLLKAAAAAAGILFLSQAGAQAQSFEQLTRDGQQAFRQQDFARALETRLKQLSMTPPKREDRCFIYWGLYTAYVLGTGEMEKGMQAVDDSIACLNAIPDNSDDMKEYRVEALRLRSNGMRDWGRYDEALAANDEQQRIQPQHIKFIDATRASNLDAKGDYEAAAAAYTRADSKNWRGYAAWMRAKQGRYDEALRMLNDSDRISARDPAKEGNIRAWVYAEQGKYEEAAANIRADERADTTNAAIHAYLRGYIEAARGNFGEAAAVFKRAAGMQSSNPTVIVASYLAQARAGRIDTSDVSALASRLNRNKWPDAQAFYITGQIDRSQFEAAAKFGNPRLERGRQCRMSLVAGEVALIKGDRATAKTDFTRAVSLCPFDTAAQERNWARGELAMLDAPSPPVAAPAAAPPVAGGGDACAYAAVHWTSAESIGTRAAYEDHQRRFPTCAFATLAAARIAALGQSAPVTPPPASVYVPPAVSTPADCKPGFTRDSDGDCVREKAARKPAPRRATGGAASEGEGGSTRGTLDCTTPAGLFSCANRAISTLPLGGSR